MYDVLLNWEHYNNNTSIFGFGSYQNGILNYKDQTIYCTQFNAEICIPSLITNNGYSLWLDNNGLSILNSINMYLMKVKMIAHTSFNYN